MTERIPQFDDSKPIVLVIDDSEDVHRLLKARLRHEELELRTVANGMEGVALARSIKPAIIHPWPEGSAQGFSQVYAAADLGYAGKPFNWITMPDQYTLSALQRAEPRSPSRPLFAEVSLISSHSPWTPSAAMTSRMPTSCSAM